MRLNMDNFKALNGWPDIENSGAGCLGFVYDECGSVDEDIGLLV